MGTQFAGEWTNGFSINNIRRLIIRHANKIAADFQRYPHIFKSLHRLAVCTSSLVNYLQIFNGYTYRFSKSIISVLFRRLSRQQCCVQSANPPALTRIKNSSQSQEVWMERCSSCIQMNYSWWIKVHYLIPRKCSVFDCRSEFLIEGRFGCGF